MKVRVMDYQTTKVRGEVRSGDNKGQAKLWKGMTVVRNNSLMEVRRNGI
jgi:hypothetical protein